MWLDKLEWAVLEITIQSLSNKLKTVHGQFTSIETDQLFIETDHRAVGLSGLVGPFETDHRAAGQFGLVGQFGLLVSLVGQFGRSVW